jgi:AraC family L-rhamnose operon regulatory protein RhaS
MTTVTIENATPLKADAIYFHPSVMNSRLTFTSINQGSPDFLYTDQVDANSLFAFRHEDQRGWLYNMGPVTNQRIQELMQTLREQLEIQNIFWPCRARSYLMELIFLIYELYIVERALTETGGLRPHAGNNPLLEPKLQIPTKSTEIQAILVYLLNNYHQKITLDHLARRFKTNRSTLNQKFKHATGSSVINYLIHLRVRMASQLLRDTELAVSEISDRIGYLDVAHFGRMFRKYTQLSPRAYRERYQREVYPAAYPEN